MNEGDRMLERLRCLLFKEELERLPEYAGESFAGHNPIYYLALSSWFPDEQSDQLLWPPFHRDIVCTFLEACYKRTTPDQMGLRVQDPPSGYLNICPREQYKTTFHHGVFIHWWLMRSLFVDKCWPRIALCHFRKEEVFDKSALLQRKFVDDPFMTEFFPEACMKSTRTLSPEGWNVEAFDRIEGIAPLKEHHIAAGSYGHGWRGHHVDLFAGDDLEGEDSWRSENIREKVKDFWTSTAPFVIDVARGVALLSGTLYDPDGLNYMLLTAKHACKELRHELCRKNGEYKYARVLHPKMMEEERPGDMGVPSIFFPPGEALTEANVARMMDDVTDDDLLNPRRHSAVILEERRQQIMMLEGNQLKWLLQFQNAMDAARSKGFDLSALTVTPLSKLPPFERIVMNIDPAIKDQKSRGTGDAMAITINGVAITAGGYRLKCLIDGKVSKTLEDREAMDAIEMLAMRHRVDVVVIEESGGVSLGGRISDRLKVAGMTPTMIVLRGQRANKLFRLRMLASDWNEGHFVIAEGCPLIKQAQFEAMEINRGSKRQQDNMLDSISQLNETKVVTAVLPPVKHRRKVRKRTEWEKLWDRGDTFVPPRRISRFFGV